MLLLPGPSEVALANWTGSSPHSEAKAMDKSLGPLTANFRGLKCSARKKPSLP